MARRAVWRCQVSLSLTGSSTRGGVPPSQILSPARLLHDFFSLSLSKGRKSETQEEESIHKRNGSGDAFSFFVASSAGIRRCFAPKTDARQTM